MTYNNNNTRQENRMYNQGFFFIILCIHNAMLCNYVYEITKHILGTCILLKKCRKNTLYALKNMNFRDFAILQNILLILTYFFMFPHYNFAFTISYNITNMKISI